MNTFVDCYNNIQNQEEGDAMLIVGWCLLVNTKANEAKKPHPKNFDDIVKRYKTLVEFIASAMPETLKHEEQSDAVPFLHNVMKQNINDTESVLNQCWCLRKEKMKKIQAKGHRLYHSCDEHDFYFCAKCFKVGYTNTFKCCDKPCHKWVCPICCQDFSSDEQPRFFFSNGYRSVHLYDHGIDKILTKSTRSDPSPLPRKKSRFSDKRTDVYEPQPILLYPQTLSTGSLQTTSNEDGSEITGTDDLVSTDTNDFTGTMLL